MGRRNGNEVIGAFEEGEENANRQRLINLLQVLKWPLMNERILQIKPYTLT